MRILIIGPMIEDKYPDRIGGTSIAVSLLSDELKNRKDILLKSVNSTGVRGSGLKGVYRFINLLFKHVDLFTIQTKSQLETVRETGFTNVKWFSNYRTMPDPANDKEHKHNCTNFIFLSRILRTKGIY